MLLRQQYVTIILNVLDTICFCISTSYSFLFNYMVLEAINQKSVTHCSSYTVIVNSLFLRVTFLLVSIKL